MIRVVLPAHLRILARAAGEVQLDVAGQATARSVLDALEDCYPMLRGTIRDQVTGQRRPFVRFFACEEDLSHEPPDAPLPAAVASGAEPFLIVGAIAGGRGLVGRAILPAAGFQSSERSRQEKSAPRPNIFSNFFMRPPVRTGNPSAVEPRDTSVRRRVDRPASSGTGYAAT